MDTFNHDTDFIGGEMEMYLSGEDDARDDLTNASSISPYISPMAQELLTFDSEA